MILLGLHSHALLNAERTDVQDMARAINDGLIDEMSFAFMIDEGKWDDSFEVFRLMEVDINRGDVSAVNYGANPYTSIGAREQDFMRMAREIPAGMAREAIVLLAKRDDVRVNITRATPDDLEGIQDWDIEDLTGEGEDASTGEFRAMPKDPSTDPIESVEAVSVPVTLGILDEDDDDPELNGTDGDETDCAGGMRGKSTSEINVHLMESDEDNETSADQMRSAGDTKPKGMSVDLLAKRFAATDFTV